jgi:hypothetical protein
MRESELMGCNTLERNFFTGAIVAPRAYLSTTAKELKSDHVSELDITLASHLKRCFEGEFFWRYFNKLWDPT